MPNDERPRDDTGKFTADTIYSKADFLEALDDAATDDPTTSDIARIIGCSPTTASNWLSQLEADGRLESRQVGNSVVWGRSD